MSEAICYRRTGNVIYQTVDSETVIINLENGRYYSLDATASAVWEDLMRQYAPETIRASFVRGGDMAKEALDGFIKELVDEQLIEPDTTNVPNRTIVAAKSFEFETPRLEKFTDMERLLPLDPIHQVGELGWPFQKGDNK